MKKVLGTLNFFRKTKRIRCKGLFLLITRGKIIVSTFAPLPPPHLVFYSVSANCRKEMESKQRWRDNLSFSSAKKSPLVNKRQLIIDMQIAEQPM